MPLLYFFVKRVGKFLGDLSSYHRDGVYGDLTQGLVRLNLRAAGGKGKRVLHAGADLDISKIYRIWIGNPKDRVYASCLMAGEDEGDDRVYLRKQGKDQSLSCCYWQFIPTTEEGGGWLIVDRRYVRFLYWSGSEILQYQSEEVGKAGIEIDENGWAKKVVARNEKGEYIKRDWPKGIVWNLPSFQGSSSFGGTIIEQPGKDRICVTARTDQDFPIYARPYGSDDVFQVWALAAVD